MFSTSIALVYTKYTNAFREDNIKIVNLNGFSQARLSRHQGSRGGDGISLPTDIGLGFPTIMRRAVVTVVVDHREACQRHREASAQGFDVGFLERPNTKKN